MTEVSKQCSKSRGVSVPAVAQDVPITAFSLNFDCFVNALERERERERERQQIYREALGAAAAAVSNMLIRCRYFGLRDSSVRAWTLIRGYHIN